MKFTDNRKSSPVPNAGKIIDKYYKCGFIPNIRQIESNIPPEFNPCTMFRILIQPDGEVVSALTVKEVEAIFTGLFEQFEFGNNQSTYNHIHLIDKNTINHVVRQTFDLVDKKTGEKFLFFDFVSVVAQRKRKLLCDKKCKKCGRCKKSHKCSPTWTFTTAFGPFSVTPVVKEQ